MLNKVCLLINSIRYYILLKLRFRKKIDMHLLNSIRGKLNIDLFSKSKIKIGKFLMMRGPIYLKCTQNAEIEIGDNCFFNHNCSITAVEKIVIGNGCKFANNLVIVDHDHDIKQGHAVAELVSEPIVIEDDVWVGANCTILKGVHIGAGAVIAAGAVVTKDVPSHSIVAGIPARRVKVIECV